VGDGVRRRERTDTSVAARRFAPLSLAGRNFYSKKTIPPVASRRPPLEGEVRLDVKLNPLRQRQLRSIVDRIRRAPHVRFP
jgi:hypothetical protein